MAEQQGRQKVRIRDRRYHQVELPDVSDDPPLFDGTDVPVQYMFAYLDRVQNLYAFLRDFPEVEVGDAVRAIREHVQAEIPVHSDRGRVSGMPVFRGSRVPMRDLFGQLAEGVTVDEYLSGFPTAGREQVIKTLELASLLMEAVAYENGL